MTKRFAILLGMFALLWYGANVQDVQALEKIVKTKRVTTISKQENLIRVADNVVILFDSSRSMGDSFRDSGMTKLQAAKKLLQLRVALLPDDIPDLKVGLYSYTPPILSLNMKGYEVFYKMQPFNKDAYLKAVDQLPEKAKGTTLLQNALYHLDSLLESLSGRTVVFLFTDGTYTIQSENRDKPSVMARELAKKYDVSFQVISTTDIETQKKIMETVATINEASRVYPLETLLDRPEFYTGAVFVLEETHIVSAENREDVVGFRLDHILFNYDMSDIEVKFTEELNAVGEILKKNPESYIVLAGFTDSRGTEEYNLGLSRRRVEAVGNYLAKKFQVDESRVSLFWYGEAAPLASNDTDEGRRKNRRVLGYIAGVN